MIFSFLYCFGSIFFGLIVFLSIAFCVLSLYLGINGLPALASNEVLLYDIPSMISVQHTTVCCDSTVVSTRSCQIQEASGLAGEYLLRLNVWELDLDLLAVSKLIQVYSGPQLWRVCRVELPVELWSRASPRLHSTVLPCCSRVC